MRTTLKRGIGRSTSSNGNGHATYPPAIFSPIRRYQQPRRRRSRWAWVGRIILALTAFALLVASGAAGGLYLYWHQSVAAVAAHSKDVKLAAKHLDIPLPNQPAIALVVGYDKRHGDTDRGRSDTMMLLRADPTTKSISMLSFPRDLITNLYCGNRIVASDRINGAYAICGSKGALDTVKHLTGLPINYLITVDFNGFIEIVSGVGGVWVDVDRRYFNKNVGTEGTNFSNIDLQPGYQLLKGRDALAYVRYRHTDSDLYRLARQQQFVKAMKQQISNRFRCWKIPKVVGAITHNVEIGHAGGGSLEGTIKRYALFAYGLPSGHIFQAKIDDLAGYDTLSAPTSSIAAAVHDFQTPDVEAPRNATAVAFGRKAAGVKTPPPSHISISVLNGNGVDGSATNAGYELGQRGYRIVVPANAADRNAPSFDYFHTKVYYDRKQPGARPRRAQGRRPVRRRRGATAAGEAPCEGPAGDADGRRRLDIPRDDRAGAGRQDAEEAASGRPLGSGPDRIAAEERAQEGGLPAHGADACSSATRTSTARCPIRTYKRDEGRARRAADVPVEPRARGVLGHRGDDLAGRAGAEAAELPSHDRAAASTTSTTAARISTWSS